METDSRVFLGMIILLLALLAHHAGMYYVSIPLEIVTIILVGKSLKKELRL